jgi:hypothetical protein
MKRKQPQPGEAEAVISSDAPWGAHFWHPVAPDQAASSQSVPTSDATLSSLGRIPCAGVLQFPVERSATKHRFSLAALCIFTVSQFLSPVFKQNGLSAGHLRPLETSRRALGKM